MSFLKSLSTDTSFSTRRTAEEEIGDETDGSQSQNVGEREDALLGAVLPAVDVALGERHLQPLRLLRSRRLVRQLCS